MAGSHPMKRFLLQLFLCFSIGLCYAQSPTDGYYRIIKEQADRMQEYLLKADFERYAGCMHPIFVKDMGGLQATAQYFEQVEKNLQKEGYLFKQHQVGEFSPIIHHENQFQGVLTIFLTYQIMGQQMLTHTHWLVVSEDHGNQWQFLEVTGQKINHVREKLPNVSPDLFIPEPVDPIYLEEGQGVINPNL